MSGSSEIGALTSTGVNDIDKCDVTLLGDEVALSFDDTHGGRRAGTERQKARKMLQRLPKPIRM
eukprot:12422942-Karenia_brevis.AAC.1